MTGPPTPQGDLCPCTGGPGHCWRTVLVMDGSSDVVRSAISSLPPAAAAVLYLVARRGASYREVADQLGWTPERVALEVRRSLLAVRTRLPRT